MNLPNGHYLQAKKYRLTHTIGQGGFGITYLGVWNTEVKGGLGVMKTAVPVCIKEYFFKDYCYRDKNSFAVKVHSITGEKLFEKFKEKLIEEANILSAVHHPNIVNVLEVFEENNTAYIVMEYIKGYSLKYILDKEGVLPEQKLIKYTHQIGNALSYVHEKNIVHLDIKPGNILIDQYDNARLIDFGVSKRYDIVEQETSTTTLTLSKGFASIEQYDNEGMLNFSPAPDIYSLGATMYNLLTGVVPIESILRATKQMLPPSAYNPKISSKTEKAILKAMEIKPEDRFRKVNQLLAVIDAPTYDFTESTPNETNPIGDEDGTEVIRRHNSNHYPEDEDDRTVMNWNDVSKSSKKNGSKHTTRRRVVLTVTILLCAFIGYAIFSYFVEISGSDGELSGLSMPGDGLPSKSDIALLTQADSIETETETPDSTVTTNHTQTQANNTKPQPTQVNNGLTNNVQPQMQANNGLANANQGTVNTQKNVETESSGTTTLTAAQKASLEKEYDDLIIGGKSKKSTGGFSGAREDFMKALAIAQKTGKDLSEVKKFIDECDKGDKVQEQASQMNNYEMLIIWGDLRVVRNKTTLKFGAINVSGKEIIPCKYMNTSPTGNGARLFYIKDDLADIYDKNGRFVTGPVNPSDL